MCTVFRNLLRLNKIIGSGIFPQRRVIAKRLIHLDKKLYSDDNDGNVTKTENKNATSPDDNNNHNPSNILLPKYKVFRDEDAQIIFDVDEEREKINLEEINAPREDVDIFEGINLERGVNGVYDIDDLVNLLHRNNVLEIFVASVPAELCYIDYIVIVSGRSSKHMNAVAEIIRRVFKKKRYSGDILPKIEGKNSKDWIALDLGNIALHIFSQQARKVYDLETLWTVGSEYDEQSKTPVDPLRELLTKHSYLGGLEPAEVSN